MLQIKNLNHGERVIKQIKVHWISYAILGGQVLMASILNFGFIALLGMNSLTLLFSCLLWMIAMIIMYVEWLNYDLDMFVITNEKIIGVEQIGFLNRKVAECNLGQVQEVNSQTRGFFSNLFNFGELFIQTAGNTTYIHMGLCPDVINQAGEILRIVEEKKCLIP